MGKTSSISYPAYSSGTVSVNGNNVATVSKDGNTINSNYNMSEAEKQIYDYAQNSMLQSLPNLNVFDKDTKSDLQRQVNAYKDSTMQTFNELYGSSLKNITNDVASRFGNLDNSMFLNNLSSLENSRNNALSQLAQDVQTYKADLYNQELSNRYNYLNLLNNLILGSRDNVLNYISSALSNANSGNSYNSNLYQNQLRSENLNNQYANMYMKLLSNFMY